MSAMMMNGFGFSRFMVQALQPVHAPTNAAKSTMTTTTTDPSGDDTERTLDTISRRSTAEADVDVEASRDDAIDTDSNTKVIEPPHQLPLAVQRSFDRVARVAVDATRHLDWHKLRSSTSLWDERKKGSASPSFRVYTRQDRGMYYAMAVGTLTCSVAELESILRPTDSDAYCNSMAELFGDAFLDGAIRYHSNSNTASDDQSPPSRSGRSRSRSRSHRRTRSGRSTTVTTPATTTPIVSGTSGVARPSFYTQSPHSATRVTTNSNIPASTPDASSQQTIDCMVKTATFARAHVFAKAQQWTFLECFDTLSSDRSSFTLTLSSLRPIHASNAKHKSTRGRGDTTASDASTAQRVHSTKAADTSASVEHLQGITAAYSVTPAAASRNSNKNELDVTFYAKFDEDATSCGPLKRHALKLVLRAFVLQLARAASHLPLIVRCKRLNAFARARAAATTSDNARAAFTTANPQCIVCTKSLHVFAKKTRCFACAYFVCDKCSLTHAVDNDRSATAATTATSVRRTTQRVWCQLCVRRVDDQTIHASPHERLTQRRPLAAPAIAAATAAAMRQQQHTTLWPPEQSVTLSTAALADRLDCILLPDTAVKQQQQQPMQKRLRRHSSSLSSLASSVLLLSPTSSSLGDAVDEAFTVATDDDDPWTTALESSTDDRFDWRIRSSQTRHTSLSPTSQHRVLPYQDVCDALLASDSHGVDRMASALAASSDSMDVDADADDDEDPLERTYPVPRNEAHRTKMAQQSLAQLPTDISSLEIICSIASTELQCPVAMVTIVAGASTHIVATNCIEYRSAVVPRGESLCAYTIMRDDVHSDKRDHEAEDAATHAPLVVHDPAHDARFCDLAIVQQRGLRFYCGFPLTSEDGSVVGALCCGDFAAPSSTVLTDDDGVDSSNSTEHGEVPQPLPLPWIEMTPQQNAQMRKLAATASRVMHLKGRDAYKRL